MFPAVILPWTQCWHLSGIHADPKDMLLSGAECHLVLEAEPCLGVGLGVGASGIKTTTWDVKRACFWRP